MKLFTLSLAAVAALASSVLGQSVDWTSSDAQACALQNWSEIQEAVNPNIASNWDFLPPFIKQAVQQAGALTADNKLVDSPTAAQILALAQSFPSGIFSPNADNIVQQCLSNTPDDSSSDEPSTSDEPVTSDEPSSSDEPTSEEPTSEEPSTSDEPTSEEPSTSDEPSSDDEPSTSDEPSSDDEPSTSDEEQSSDDEPSTSDENPTSSAPDYTAEPSSTPIKCIPRN
ncbi:hypothetical protein H4S02_001679 [Coemansia sp. RSA 2611]|nr:hypothetical protein H4S02_001679 [Coemansia sp. RSA 2611]